MVSRKSFRFIDTYKHTHSRCIHFGFVRSVGTEVARAMDTIVKMPVVTHVTWREAENARAAKAQAKTIMGASEQAAIVQRYETETRKKAELDLKANAFLWHSPFSKKFPHSIHCPKHIATPAAVLQHRLKRRLCRDQAPKIPPETIYSSSSSSKTPPENDDDTMKPKSDNDDRDGIVNSNTQSERENEDDATTIRQQGREQ